MKITVQMKNIAKATDAGTTREDVAAVIESKLDRLAGDANLNVVVRRYDNKSHEPIKYSTNINGSVDGHQIKISAVDEALMGSVHEAADKLRRVIRKTKEKKKSLSLENGKKFRNSEIEFIDTINEDINEELNDELDEELIID